MADSSADAAAAAAAAAATAPSVARIRSATAPSNELLGRGASSASKSYEIGAPYLRSTGGLGRC